MENSIDSSSMILSQTFSQELKDFDIQVSDNKRKQFQFERPTLNLGSISTLKRLRARDSLGPSSEANNRTSLTTNQDGIFAIYPQKYKQMEELGKGCHSRVFKVQKYSNNKIYAAKVIQIESEETKEIVKKEYNLIYKLKHAHIIKPKELIYDEYLECYIIIQELFVGQTLDNMFHSRQNRFSDKEKVKILKQLLETVEFLHELNIVHRDITVHNVLYHQNTQQIKLIDFGISKEYCNYQEEFMISPKCNEIYAPPEYKDQSNMFCNEKIDEFQCGLILLSLLENRTISSSKRGKILKNAQYKQNEGNLQTLCAKLLRKNPQNRLSAKEALQFLKNIES